MQDDTANPRVDESVRFLRSRFGLSETPPAVGLVLGSGLGALGDQLAAAGGCVCDYSTIPNFPAASVVGHQGRLIHAMVENTPAFALQGRSHRYEGLSARETVFAVDVLLALNCRTFVITNAAGGINERLRPGDLMLIDDHINLTGDNPFLGHSSPVSRNVPDVYSPRLRDIAESTAVRIGLKPAHGTYACMPGPNYETPAEIRMLRFLGGDAVGMSTVHEAMTAVAGGADVLGISCITNAAAGLSDQQLDHSEVTQTAKRVEKDFCRWLLEMIPEIGNQNPAR